LFLINDPDEPETSPVTNYIIYISMVYDVPQCTNIWLDLPSRETTLFRVRLSHMEGRDLP
jgi:hypothetical protein